MKCEEIKPQLTAFADGELAHVEHEMVEDHLISCGDCQKSFAEIKRAINAVTALRRVAAPDGFAAKVRGRLRERSEPVRKIELPDAARSSGRQWIGIAVAAAAVIVMALALPFYIERELPGEGTESTGMTIKMPHKPVIKPEEKKVITKEAGRAGRERSEKADSLVEKSERPQGYAENGSTDRDRSVEEEVVKRVDPKKAGIGKMGPPPEIRSGADSEKAVDAERPALAKARPAAPTPSPAEEKGGNYFFSKTGKKTPAVVARKDLAIVIPDKNADGWPRNKESRLNDAREKKPADDLADEFKNKKAVPDRKSKSSGELKKEPVDPGATTAKGTIKENIRHQGLLSQADPLSVAQKKREAKPPVGQLNIVLSSSDVALSREKLMAILKELKAGDIGVTDSGKDKEAWGEVRISAVISKEGVQKLQSIFDSVSERPEKLAVAEPGDTRQKRLLEPSMEQKKEELQKEPEREEKSRDKRRKIFRSRAARTGGASKRSPEKFPEDNRAEKDKKDADRTLRFDGKAQVTLEHSGADLFAVIITIRFLPQAELRALDNADPALRDKK